MTIKYFNVLLASIFETYGLTYVHFDLIVRFILIQVTLRYLATGQSMTSLHYEWRISVSALSHIIIEVCEAILKNLKSQWLKTPVTADEWLMVSEGFQRWNYPNCLGSRRQIIRLDVVVLFETCNK